MFLKLRITNRLARFLQTIPNNQIFPLTLRKRDVIKSGTNTCENETSNRRKGRENGLKKGMRCVDLSLDALFAIRECVLYRL